MEIGEGAGKKEAKKERGRERVEKREHSGRRRQKDASSDGIIFSRRHTPYDGISATETTTLLPSLVLPFISRFSYSRRNDIYSAFSDEGPAAVVISVETTDGGRQSKKED